MTSWLYLSAEGLSEPSAQWPCCLVTESGEQLALTLAEAAPKLQGQAVGLVLPMEMCGWLQTETWPSRRRPDVRTVAYSIEEQLALRAVGGQSAALCTGIGVDAPAGDHPGFGTGRCRPLTQ